MQGQDRVKDRVPTFQQKIVFIKWSVTQDIAGKMYVSSKTLLKLSVFANIQLKFSVLSGFSRYFCNNIFPQINSIKYCISATLHMKFNIWLIIFTKSQFWWKSMKNIFSEETKINTISCETENSQNLTDLPKILSQHNFSNLSNFFLLPGPCNNVHYRNLQKPYKF